MNRNWAVLALVIACIRPCAGSDTPEPANSIEWFARAANRMNLRMPGATPFHMTVRFHAYPGDQMLGPKEKSDLITGDGTYEEIWLDPHQWRREITLASYHATEVEGHGVRKFQASSDYEPSRVLMLLTQLNDPVPRALASREFHSGSGWKIDHVTTGDLNLVRLSKTTGSEHADYTDSFYFYPQGILALTNYTGMIATRASYVEFGGKAVPRSLAIQAAGGQRNLLTADIRIEPPGEIDPSQFDLPGGPAEPGMTLRPLEFNQVKAPDLSGHYSWQSSTLGPHPVYSLVGVLDRHGYFRELEILLAPNPQDAGIFMQQVRADHKKPATLDGSPCEVVMRWIMM